MDIIKGSIEGTALDNRHAIVGEKLSVRSMRFAYELKGNVLSVDIIDQQKARGLTGAAGGAVLGFLLAGPVGTVLGGAAGAGGRNRTVAAISFTNGDSIYGDVSPQELATLKAAQTATMMRGLNEAQKESEPDPVVSQVSVPPTVPPVIKGRSKKEVPLPKIPLLEDFKHNASEIGPVAVAASNDIAYLSEQYNLFKWRHLDKIIEYDEEVYELSKLAIVRTYLFSKGALEIAKEIEQQSELISAIKSEELPLREKLRKAKSNLESAGLFSRGPYKKEIASIDQKLNSVISKIRRSIEALIEMQEKLPEDSVYIECSDGPVQVQRLAEKIFGDDSAEMLKKGRSRLPTKRDYFQLWQDAESSHSTKNVKVTKEEDDPALEGKDKSVKERLLELNSLLKDGLISDDEHKKKKESLLQEL